MSRQRELTFMRAHAERKKGNILGARQLYQSILRESPRDARALKAIAELPADTGPSATGDHDPQSLIKLFGEGRFQEVVDKARPLVASAGNRLLALNLLGAAYGRLNLPAEAIDAYTMALTDNPNFVEAQNNLGNLLMHLGRYEEAAAAMERAVALKPDFAQAHNSLGALYLKQGRPDDALAALRRALDLHPDLAEAHNNVGNILADRGRTGDAEAHYLRALHINPGYAPAYANLGNMLARVGRFEEARAAIERALALNPDFPEAHNGLGNILSQLGRREEAAASYRRALALRPDDAMARMNLANIMSADGRLEEAAAMFADAARLDPDNGPALAQNLFVRAEMGDWTIFDDYAAMADRLAQAKSPPPPFPLLIFDDDPARGRALAERYAREHVPPAPPPAYAPRTVRPPRLKVGYFSADFHNHATLRLMAGLFRAHDRDRFEIQAYSYGRERSGAQREALAGQVDALLDIADMADDKVVGLAHALQLDIAVDLKGHTRQGRMQLFAGRLAPIQIHYLGYPGTIGAPFIDYIIADAVVIPPDEQHHYTEKVIQLSGSYQINDNERIIGNRPLSRAELGLPERGFVFCCFNNSYKITPAEFDIWMRLLRDVESAVLWLLRPNPWIESSLREAARARGVHPDRLIFADRVGQADHLARHAHADLFLDTFNVNAHTTASDALWAGLPVLTRLGRGFAARVAGSLLHAIGLPELIATSDTDYERIALALATNPDRLASVRTKLAENRLTTPLFDTVGTTRRIEAAYDAAYDHYLTGAEPAALVIA